MHMLIMHYNLVDVIYYRPVHEMGEIGAKSHPLCINDSQATIPVTVMHLGPIYRSTLPSKF
jgi:hypothetical protein